MTGVLNLQISRVLSGIPRIFSGLRGPVPSFFLLRTTQLGHFGVWVRYPTMGSIHLRFLLRKISCHGFPLWTGTASLFVIHIIFHSHIYIYIDNNNFNNIHIRHQVPDWRKGFLTPNDEVGLRRRFRWDLAGGCPFMIDIEIDRDFDLDIDIYMIYIYIYIYV